MGWRQGTANVRNTPDLPREAVRRCAEVVAGHVDVCGWQEIAEAEDHADLKVHLPETSWWWHDASGREVPQSFRKSRWVPAEDKELPAWASPFMLAKISDYIPGVNPNRYLAWSFMRRRFHDGTVSPHLICHFNTHWVNGAFSTPGQRAEEERVKRFWQGWENCKAIVERVHDIGTVAIIFSGDLNATSLPKFVPAQRWLWATAIDKMAVIDAADGQRGARLDLVPGSVLSVDDPSDHNLRLASVRMVNPHG
jgi:hypothetical protein